MTTSAVSPAPTAAVRWTPGALAAFWLPLALSWTMMIIAQPITAIAISRLPEPEVHLAAYGVTFDISFLLESPILMLLSVSVALTRDQASYRRLRTVTLWLAGVFTCLFAVVAFTPAYGPIVRGLIGVPERVAAEVRPALQFLLPWIGVIAWRRFHQGPIISARLTHLISYGTLIRLVTLAIVLGAGLTWPVLPGATLGALALSASVVVESLANTIWAMPVVRRLPPTAPDGLGTGGIARFATPLAVTDVMRTIVRPTVAAGVSRAVLPQVSLAAWPVATSLITLLGAGAMSFQEMAVAVIDDRDSYRRVRRFILTIGVALSLLTMLLVATPAIRLVLGGVVGLPATLQPHVVLGMRILIPLPLLMAIRNLLRGVLIRQRFTSPIQLAMVVAVVALVVMLAVGVAAKWPGVTVAAVATVSGQTAEILALYPFFRRALRDLA